MSLTLILPGFTRLRSARIPSTISLWDSLAAVSETGASTAAGIPCRVIVILSPRGTRSSKVAKWVFASNAPMVSICLPTSLNQLAAQLLCVFRQLQKVFADRVQIRRSELVGRHNAALGDAIGIGEMLFEPGAIVAQPDAIQRRRQSGADTVDLMTRIAMVGLIDHGALGREIRRRFDGLLVSRREREDEKGERIQVGVGQIDRRHHAARHNLRWILEVRHQISDIAMLGRNPG